MAASLAAAVGDRDLWSFLEAHGPRTLMQFLFSLGAFVQVGWDSCPCILIVCTCICTCSCMFSLPRNTDTYYIKKDHDFYQTVKGQAGGFQESGCGEIHGEREKLGGILEQNFRFIKKLLREIGICILYLLSNIKNFRPFFHLLLLLYLTTCQKTCLYRLWKSIINKKFDQFLENFINI